MRLCDAVGNGWATYESSSARSTSTRIRPSASTDGEHSAGRRSGGGRNGGTPPPQPRSCTARPGPRRRVGTHELGRTLRHSLDELRWEVNLHPHEATSRARRVFGKSQAGRSRGQDASGATPMPLRLDAWTVEAPFSINLSCARGIGEVMRFWCPDVSMCPCVQGRG